jgi:hypothetical protein
MVWWHQIFDPFLESIRPWKGLNFCEKTLRTRTLHFWNQHHQIIPKHLFSVGPYDCQTKVHNLAACPMVYKHSFCTCCTYMLYPLDTMVTIPFALYLIKTNADFGLVCMVGQRCVAWQSQGANLPPFPTYVVHVLTSFLITSASGDAFSHCCPQTGVNYI